MLNSQVKKWLIFVLLCLIWGSSFILMKLGLYDKNGQTLLTPYQVASLRIFSAGLAMVPFFLKAIRRIPRSSWPMVIVAGLIGNFLPAFLFCLAETHISSALAAMLNTLTPLFALLLAAIVYHIKIPFNQVIGVGIGLAGCVMLFLNKLMGAPANMFFASLVLVAAVCYGLNANLVRQKLSHIKSIDIAAGSFVVFLLPTSLILVFTGYFKFPLGEHRYVVATAAASSLGLLGTAFASVIFYQLVKIAGTVFASMVTYGIPLIALGWGFLYGEDISKLELLALVVILSGVFMASTSGAAFFKKFKAKKASVIS